jgi:hypothetical protein
MNSNNPNDLNNIEPIQKYIYKIQHKELKDLLYVGSSVDMNQRLRQHKYACNNENSSKYHFKIYVMIRENGGWEMFDKVELERAYFDDNQGARMREKELMKELKASMNSIEAYVNPDVKEYKKEHYEANIEKRKDQMKASYEANKEKRKEYQRIYRTKKKA